MLLEVDTMYALALGLLTDLSIQQPISLLGRSTLNPTPLTPNTKS